MIAGLNSSLINSVTRARTWGRTSVPSFFPQREQLIMNPVLLREFSKKLLTQKPFECVTQGHTLHIAPWEAEVY